MRIFIAVEIPDWFRFEAAGLARQLGAHVKGRFVDSDSYHVTLAFLGDVDERSVRLAMDALDAACSGVSAVSLASDGLGIFGKARDATLWLGLQERGGIAELAQRTRNELSARGVSYDEKSFKPHITLARRAALPDGSLPALAFPDPAVADAVTLFKSELSSEGAVYHPLHTAFLQTE